MTIPTALGLTLVPDRWVGLLDLILVPDRRWACSA